MPTNPMPAGKEPAEGSRETIDQELRSASKKERTAQTTARPLAAGDDAAPGTPGTGEDVCPECHGTGKLGAKPCSNCNGSGRVIKGIGGA
jgi:RecJ-like exonuclease